MPVDAAAIHWTDGVGLALVAFGLVSGWMRGFLNQSTRLGVLIVALALASFSELPSEWLATQFDFRPEDTPAAVPIIELGIFAVALLALGLVRNFFFLWLGGPMGASSRAIGALLGAAGALVLYVILLCGVAWAGPPETIQGTYGYPVAQVLMDGASKVPTPPRPIFLNPEFFPGSEAE